MSHYKKHNESLLRVLYDGSVIKRGDSSSPVRI